MTDYVTIVGTRDLSYYGFMLLRLVGEISALRGLRGRSGLAPGADTAGYDGARRASNFAEVGFDNYLPDATMFFKSSYGWRKPDPEKNIYDATTFTDTYEKAREIALAARGGPYGLTEAGLKLHTRNAYQVLGHSLDLPSKQLFCWAEPVGVTTKVKGGTNTAVALALSHQIPVANLWYVSAQERFLKIARAHYNLLSTDGRADLENCERLYNDFHGTAEQRVSDQAADSRVGEEPLPEAPGAFEEGYPL